MRARSRRILTPVLILILLTVGCRRSSAPAPPTPSGPADGGTVWFEECARDVGIDFDHVPHLQRRHYFPEIMGAGGCLVDVDGDGWLDVYLIQGGDLDPPAGSAPPGNRLFRNDGAGSFTDITARAGVGDTGYGMGCAAGDYDADGDTDLYVTNVGPNVLYRNDGDGTFTDVTATAGVADPGWSTSAAFIDYDRDGHLDVVLANYLNWSPAVELQCMNNTDERDYCKPTNYAAPARDTLYRNRGDGTFSDVTTTAGLGQAFGNGLGVCWGDFDANGRLDMYVANDGTANQLWMQKAGGTFAEDALLAGCALNRAGAAEAGMGVIPVDIDHDGDLDLFMTHLRNESNTLYINNGAGSFDDATAAVGLAASSLAFTGFGLGMADFDLDGHLDLYIANGRVMKEAPYHDPLRPYDEPNQLLAGARGGQFNELQPPGGTRPPLVANSRGALFGDLDNDGDVDIVVCNNGGQAHVLRNTAPRRGGWLTLDVRERHGGPALGAIVQVSAGQRSWFRTVQPAYSYCSSNDPRVHVGLGAVEAVDDIRVRWLDGQVQAFGRHEINRVHVLTRE